MKAPLVVAVDGGGSKTDVAVVDPATGATLGRHRGPGCSHHQVGLDLAVERIDTSVRAALREAAASPEDVVHAGCYLTAMDLPSESALMRERLSVLPWARESVTVDNDVFALLRTGTESPDAAVVVCGTGINGAAVRADGAVARIIAFGQVSGDWGGGSGLAEEILWHAARAEDGRGEPTVLREALLEWTGRASVQDVSVAVHAHELSVSSWWDRMPELFRFAHAGDAVATELVRRQGEEIGVLAATLLERVELDAAPVPVVLGGGIGSSGDAILEGAILLALRRRCPRAQTLVVRDAPLVGAVRLALAEVRRQRSSHSA
jgi:N-acetylglucosamine kinase-like BadF-type ATPase